MELQIQKWSSASYQQVTEHLQTLAEKDYRQFRIKIVKSPTPILGIRQPTLRKFAAQILKGDALSFLNIQKGKFFEEQMLHGYVLAGVDLPYEQKRNLIFAFLEHMDNWSICDDFVTALKPFLRQNRPQFLTDIRFLADDQNPWKVRFLLVVLLESYLEPEFLKDAVSLCTTIHREEYYIEMAQAWLLSMAYLRDPALVMRALSQRKEDCFLVLKTISKILDSYQTTEEQKTGLRHYREEYKKWCKNR